MIAAPVYSTPDSDGPRWAEFSRKYVRHTKGRWARQPFEPEPWQLEFMTEALEIDGHTGNRVYREVLLIIPKKNGKSFMASDASVYLLVADGEEGPEVYIAAAALKQAGVVFNQSRQFLLRSPRLLDWVIIRRGYIECPSNDGIMRVLAADAHLQHGLNPSASVVDELWAHKSPDLYVALTTGTAARENPFTLTITTEAPEEESLLGQIVARAMALPDQSHPTPFLTIARDRATGFLMYRYAVPDGADLEDPATWKGANPASWITPEYLATQRHSTTLPYRDFLLFHLNRRSGVEQSWLPAGAWAACAAPEHPLDPALPLYVMVDASLNNDSTAIVASQRQGERTVQRSWIWENPYPLGANLRAFWQVPMNEVKDRLRGLRRDYPVPACAIDHRIMPGPEFDFDPAYFGDAARDLEGEGLAMVKIDQTDNRMCPPAMAYRTFILEKKIAHDGDAAFGVQVNNAIQHAKGYGRFRLTKPGGSHRKIDAAIAGAVSAHRAQQGPPPKSRSRSLVSW